MYPRNWRSNTFKCELVHNLAKRDWSPKKVPGCSRRRLKGPGWIPKAFFIIFTWLFWGGHGGIVRARSKPFGCIQNRSVPYNSVKKSQFLHYETDSVSDRTVHVQNPFEMRSKPIQNPFGNRSWMRKLYAFWPRFSWFFLGWQPGHFGSFFWPWKQYYRDFNVDQSDLCWDVQEWHFFCVFRCSFGHVLVWNWI